MASASGGDTSTTPRFDPNIPIPNNPFYSPESSFLKGDQGQLIVGSGLTVNYNTGVISASGGGGGGAVNLVTGGTGITVSPTTGNVVVTNTGVLQLTAGTGISLGGSKANYTINATTLGTVTSVTAGSGLTGGVITSSGTLAVDGTVVVLKSLYAAKGQILVSTGANTPVPLASSGFPSGYLLTLDTTQPTGMKWAPAPTAVQSVAGIAPINVSAGVNPVITIDTATTANSGATTLVNDVVTNDPTKALTAAQGYALQQQINGLGGAGGLTLAGTINASTGNMVTVTANGAGVGFTVGSPLPAAALANQDYFVIVTVAGSFTPPGGSLTAATQGDWFNSTGTAWDFLNVGFDAPAATTTVAGIVCLATSGEAILGTDSTKALTPAAAKAAYIPVACLTNKGTLVTASTPTNAVALPVGADGSQLVACSLATSGLCWLAPPPPSIPCACITGKGVILGGTATCNPSALAAGADGQYLQANSLASTGLCWVTPPYIPCACITGKGALITGPSAGNPVALSVGTDGQVLSANSLAANGLCWCTPAYIPCSIVTAKGGIVGGSALGTPVYQAAAPADGCLLASCAACTSGITWICPPQRATPNVFGYVQGYTCSTSGNAFFGQQAGILSTTSATQTTAIGQSALGALGASNSTCDTFIGACTAAAPGSYTTGCLNVAVGAKSLFCLGAGATRNTAVGSEIYGSSNYTGTALTGCQNVIIGHGVRVPVTTGSCQLAIGFCANFPGNPSVYWLTGCSDGTIRPGFGILDCTGSPGTPKSSSGGSVLYSCGISGVVWGCPPAAAAFCQGGYFGCDLGGTGIAIGLSAGTQAAGSSGSGCFNDATIVGPSSVCLIDALQGTTTLGTKIGATANSLTSLSGSTYIGSCVNYVSNSSGMCENTFVGACSGFENEGSCNTYIGFAAASALPYTGTNNTVIGWCAQPSSATVSNTVTLGNSSITTIRAAVTSITAISDARDKTNVRILPVGIEFVKELNPVSFQWQYREGNPTKDGTVDAGFLAQQLQEVQNKFNADYLGLVNTDNPDRFEATPGKLIPVLVRALQELTEAHERLRADFDSYRSNHR